MPRAPRERGHPVTESVTSADADPALLGRYDPPAVQLGDRVFCRYRRAWCYVTGWGTGPIRWPRVQQVNVRGRPGLLVNATLERAVRTESAAALMHWFGLSSKSVMWWRRAFGVAGVVGTPGSRATRGRARGALVMAGAERAVRLRRWTAEELARLGTAPAADVAEALGRSVACVTRQRARRGVPPYRPES